MVDKIVAFIAGGAVVLLIIVACLSFAKGTRDGIMSAVTNGEKFFYMGKVYTCDHGGEQR